MVWKRKRRGAVKVLLRQYSERNAILHRWSALTEKMTPRQRTDEVGKLTMPGICRMSIPGRGRKNVLYEVDKQGGQCGWIAREG